MFRIVFCEIRTKHSWLEKAKQKETRPFGCTDGGGFWVRWRRLLVSLAAGGLLWAGVQRAKDLLEHDVVQIVDNDLLLQGDHALRVQELRFLKQQLVSIHLVLLQARR